MTTQKVIPCEFVAGLCSNCGEAEQLDCEGWVAPVDQVEVLIKERDALKRELEQLRAAIDKPASKPIGYTDEALINEFGSGVHLGWFKVYTHADEVCKTPVYAAPVQQWIPTATQMPEPCTKVLAYSGKPQPIRAQWVPAKTLDATYGDSGFGEYDEAADQYFWPEGWYETNEYEEAHWLVDTLVSHWMPLPDVPKGDKP